jgi:hypothetical protein
MQEKLAIPFYSMTALPAAMTRLVEDEYVQCHCAKRATNPRQLVVQRLGALRMASFSDCVLHFLVSPIHASNEHDARSNGGTRQHDPAVTLWTFATDRRHLAWTTTSLDNRQCVNKGTIEKRKEKEWNNEQMK